MTWAATVTTRRGSDEDAPEMKRRQRYIKEWKDAV